MKSYDAYDLSAFGAVPSERQLEHLKLGRKAFFHFGVNTFTDLEWGEGTERESVFDPQNLDCRQWIRTVKEAGYKLAIITAKHHDGFCLWPSKYSEHTVKNSPYKNGNGDIIREFTDACHEYGIKAGVYISPWDRHSPLWGTDEYSVYYENQLVELLSNYGRIDEVWWDGAGSGETPYNWKSWAETIRRLQPHACIFGSIGATPWVECRWCGNEEGFAGDPCYETVNEDALYTEETSHLNRGDFCGERFIPAEVDVSIRPGWFYHENQVNDVRSAAALVRLWFESVGRGQMELLNFPPDRRGIIHEADAANAIEAGRRISAIFENNLAKSAKTTASSTRHADLTPENVLNDGDSFWSPCDGLPASLELSFDAPVTFDVFSVSEEIRLGQRIDGFRVEAFVCGEWKTIADKKSMGYKWAEYFEPVTSDRVRLVIYSAAAAPVINSFELYKMPDGTFAEEKKTKERSNLVSRIEYAGNSAVVNFGGIYEFNTVDFYSEEKTGYILEAFDGASWYELERSAMPKSGRIVCSVANVSGSYQIRLTLDHKIDESTDIHVFG